MRFKKGSKIEVFSTSEVPSGAWRCADIISGNGHNYTVRYVHYPGMKNKTLVERASRKTIRPCPPPVDCVESWVAGDLLEVYDNFSWKIAKILNVLSGECFLVRLLGSSKEFQTPKVNIRLRQSWQGDKWIVIGKGSGSSDVKSNRISMLNWQTQRNFQLGQADADLEVNARCSCLCIENTYDFQESHFVSARTLKRASPFTSSYAGAYTGNIQKMRAIEKEGEQKRQQVISVNPSSLIKKGQGWRHACLATTGLKMTLGLPPLPWHNKWENISIQFSTNKRLVESHCTLVSFFFSCLLIKFISGVLVLVEWLTHPV